MLIHSKSYKEDAKRRLVLLGKCRDLGFGKIEMANFLLPVGLFVESREGM
jgi:hypothetical protein